MINPQGEISTLKKHVEVLAALLGVTLDDLKEQYPQVQAAREERKRVEREAKR